MPKKIWVIVRAGLGDRTWPLAIILSIIWPIFIPIGYFSVTRFFPDSSFFNAKPLLIFIAILLTGFVLLGQSAVILSGTAKRLSKSELINTAVVTGNLDILRRHYTQEDMGKINPDPLIGAIFNRKQEMALFLIEQRSDLDRYDPMGDQQSVQFATPLHTAVNVGVIEIVRALLAKKSNPNIKNQLGQTPAHAISWDPDGNGEILTLLAEKGTDFNVEDDYGDTPLIVLTKVLNQWEQMPEYAKKIVSAGGNIAHRNKSGLSAADYAKQNYHAETAEYLLEKLEGK